MMKKNDNNVLVTTFKPPPFALWPEFLNFVKKIFDIFCLLSHKLKTEH